MSKANLVKFVTWGVDKKLRREISVDPARVASTEQFSDAFTAAWGEEFPAATRIVLRDGRATFLVQGDHGDVVDRLNGRGGEQQGATTADAQGDPAGGQPPQPLGQQPAGQQASPVGVSGPQGDPACRQAPAEQPPQGAGGSR